MSGRATLAAMIVGGIAVGAALPKLLPMGRRLVRGVGGMNYTAVPMAGPRPQVNPALARPA
jgi:hypothetical protein